MEESRDGLASVVVLTGGGIKSAVAAARYQRDHELILLHVDHGQSSSPSEVKALAMLAASWPKSRLCTTALPPIKYMPSAVRAGTGMVSSADRARSGDEPVGSGLERRGLLPVMLSLAAQTALRFGAGAVVIGVSEYASGEHIGLPGLEADCDSVREALHSFDIMLESLVRPKMRLRVEAPLLDLTLPQIIKLGQRFEVSWERTYSCEKPAGPCGVCTQCQMRARAFLEAAVRDSGIPTPPPLLKPVAVAP